MKQITIFIIVALILVVGVLSYNKLNNDNETGNSMKVKLETNKGDIIIQLYDDMPITTGNFINLVNRGTYNGVIFHRVIDGFMLQGGDPTGTGYGDPSIPNIKDEFT